MAGGVYYPPAPQSGSNGPANFPYDVVIQENFPGVVFIPQEAGGVYSVIREVDGALWFVNNADWNPNTSRWEQNSPANANNPAFAMVLFANGSQTRYETPATDVPGTAISWVQLHNISSDGSVQSTPAPPASAPGVSDQLTVTWDAGIDSKMFAHVTNITDTASEADSVYDYLIVNGVGKWLVDKNGVLQEGSIPFARITGFSPVFNNATFTGTTTFEGPVVTEAGITNTGDISTTTLHASGAVTASSFSISGGGSLADAPATTSANVNLVAAGSPITLQIHSSHGYAPGTTVLVYGTGTNAVESFTGIVTAINSQPATTLTVTCIAIISGTAGDVLNSGAVVGFSTVNSLPTSSDGSIAVTRTGTLVAPNLNFTVALPRFPAVVQNSFVVPSVGSPVSVSIKASDSLPYVADQYVWVYGNGGTPQFLGILGTGTAIGGGLISIPITNLEVTQGLVGEGIGAGDGYVTFASFDPNLLSPGKTFACAANFAVGLTTGNLSFPVPLTGTASNNYLIIVAATMELQNGSKTFTFTGSGATWPNSPQTYNNGSAATFPAAFYGTAVGGQTPSVTWSTNDVLGFTPMTMVMTAYLQ